ncbi:MAG TPA: hypothetical protein VFI15_03185 [Candidatus Limnocylindrales bacterium]|nr:hypothetical protein [Candidatus Limnocylindrales bacterium]
MATRTASKEKVFSDVELEAARETARERKRQAKRSPADERTEGEADVQAKIAEMPADDRRIATRIHQIVATEAPAFVPRTYYGMPAYARDGKVICFFQSKSKFKVRYSTFGFQPDARIDDGEMWPVAFAVTELNPRVEARIAELVKKAAA